MNSGKLSSTVVSCSKQIMLAIFDERRKQDPVQQQILAEQAAHHLLMVHSEYTTSWTQTEKGF